MTLRTTKPERVIQWVTALRSGEYDQATKYLRTSEGFCCWGVACDLQEPDAWEPIKSFAITPYYEFTLSGASSLPTFITIDWLGIVADYNSDDEDEIDGFVEYLANNNDSGLSFDEIADYIVETFFP